VATIPVTSVNMSYTDTNSPSLSVGLHTLEAVYSGDKNYIAGTFNAEHAIVPVIYPTATTLTAAPNPAVASQTVRFTATVTSPGQNANAPNPLSGTVVFRDGSTNLGTAQVAGGGVATFDTSLLSAGTHSVAAFYLGYTAQLEQTASFAPSNSTSVMVAITASATSTTLTGMPTSVPAGGIVSLTAVVASSAGAPTGAVTFLDGTSPLSAEPLDATGTAVFSATFGNSGTHTLTAAYQANANFAASSSSPLSISVTTGAQAVESTTQLTAVPSSQLMNQIVLTANVRSRSVEPTGGVTFFDGGNPLGVVTLNNQGTATYPVTLATLGLHYLTAAYSGNSKLRPSVSATVLERAPSNDADFSLDLSEASVTVQQEQSTSFLVTATSINGFSGKISLSCAPATSEMSCQVQRSSLPSGHGSSLVTINTSQSHTGASSAPSISLDQRGPAAGMLVVSFIGMLMLLAGRRGLGLSSICFLCVMVAAGCVSPSSVSHNATPVGTYVVTIQAASIGSNTGMAVTHAASVQILVVARTGNNLGAHAI
jgi:Big-like domain-containing protein